MSAFWWWPERTREVIVDWYVVGDLLEKRWRWDNGNWLAIGEQLKCEEWRLA